MKITRVETFLVPPRWLFCRIETDDGIVGWGEPVVEGRAEVVRAAVEVLAEYLHRHRTRCGSPDHWQVLSRGGFYRDGPVLVQRRRRHRPGAVGHRGQGLRRAGARAARRRRCATGSGCTRGSAATSRPNSPSRSRRRSRPGFTAVKMNACGRMSPIASPGRGGGRGGAGGGRPRGARPGTGHGDRLPRPLHPGHRAPGPARARPVPPAVRRGAGAARAPAMSWRRSSRRPRCRSRPGSGSTAGRASCRCCRRASRWCSRTCRTRAGSAR